VHGCRDATTYCRVDAECGSRSQEGPHHGGLSDAGILHWRLHEPLTGHRR
jgi:hypothetical protein